MTYALTGVTNTGANGSEVNSTVRDALVGSGEWSLVEEYSSGNDRFTVLRRHLDDMHMVTGWSTSNQASYGMTFGEGWDGTAKKVVAPCWRAPNAALSATGRYADMSPTTATHSISSSQNYQFCATGYLFAFALENGAYMLIDRVKPVFEEATTDKNLVSLYGTGPSNGYGSYSTTQVPLVSSPVSSGAVHPTAYTETMVQTGGFGYASPINGQRSVIPATALMSTATNTTGGTALLLNPYAYFETLRACDNRAAPGWGDTVTADGVVYTTLLLRTAISRVLLLPRL